MSRRKLKVSVDSLLVDSFDTGPDPVPGALGSARITRILVSGCGAGCDPSALQPPCTSLTYAV